MNPFLNPFVSIPFIKNYMMDPDRLHRLNHNQLLKYQSNALRKILRYAQSVPLYQQKYSEQNFHLSTIKTIDDAHHIPLTSKQDLRDSFPDKLLPINSKKEKSFIVGTGGTTGEPVSIYTDFPTMLRGTAPGLRELKHFGLHWKKSRIVHLGNFNEFRVDSVFQENMLKYVQSFTSTDNILNIDVNEPIISIMNRLNTFKPYLIISYPAIFQHLAFLKRKGHGPHVNPKILQVGGAMLDEYTREYVEDAFKCPLLNIYPSVEAQANIALNAKNITGISTRIFSISKQ